MAGDTGNGTTVGFSSTTITGHLFQQLDGGEQTLGKVPTSSLATTGDATFIPADLRDNSDVTGTLIFVATGALPALGTVETLTITHPIHTSGNTTNATTAGTGFISRIGKPNMVNDTLAVLPFSWTWDGETGPTFTAESA